MAGAFLRACATPRCSGTATRGLCDACRKRRQGQAPSTTAKGYVYRWRRYSEGFRVEFPLCGEGPDLAAATSNSVCARDGRTTSARVVDHIQPVTGPDDPLFWERNNHGSLCDTCHQVKRRREVRRR